MADRSVQVKSINKWVQDWQKWYKKTYYLDSDVFDDTRYGAANRHAYKVISDILEHMVDDVKNGKSFSDESKEYFDRLVRGEDDEDSN